MMRAPDQPLRTVTGRITGFCISDLFDETQRRQIETSLAAVGIALDAAALNDLQVLGMLTLVPCLMPGGRLPTPKQQAGEMRKALALLEQTRRVRIDLGDAFRTALTDKIAELRDQIDQRDAMGSASAKSASKVRNDYWRTLAMMWRTYKPDVGPFRRKHLRNFLRACSWPLPSWLPKMTERELDRKLDSFIKNLFHPKRAPKFRDA